MTDQNGFVFGSSNKLTITITLLLIAIFAIIYFVPNQFDLALLIFNQSVSFIPQLVLIIILFIFFLILFNFFEYVIKKSKIVDDRSKLTIIHLSKLLWWTIFVILTAIFLFKNVDALITSLGLIGLGLSFALQKPVLNMVGWFTIVTKDIYSEGDRISVGIIRGDVKEIQVMNTILYGLLENSDIRNQKLVTIPNELVLTTNVENYTKNFNYILEELTISITYESDYKKAMELLENIILKRIKENIKAYINKEKRKKIKLNSFLDQKKNKEIVSSQINEVSIQKEILDIQKEIDHLSEKGDEFKPKIRLEMADSALILIAQFLTPYNQVKKNRTEINLAFLDMIKKDGNIEVAYPHMELVLGKRSNTGISSLKKFE
ncbi:MAG: mechanosensitive ion channel [Candidatus ainarchaeum sp.]|nr:mechanosensitive ion channel [Candidatus ainarchaeum sp.]